VVNHLSLSERVGQFKAGLVSSGPIVYGVCSLKIRSLIVKKESLEPAGQPTPPRYNPLFKRA